MTEKKIPNLTPLVEAFERFGEATIQFMKVFSEVAQSLIELNEVGKLEVPDVLVVDMHMCGYCGISLKGCQKELESHGAYCCGKCATNKTMHGSYGNV